MSTENAHVSYSGNGVVEYTDTKEESVNVCASASQDSDTENNDEIDFSAPLLGTKAGITVSTEEDAILAEIMSMETTDEPNHVNAALKQVLSTSTEFSQTELQSAEAPLNFAHIKLESDDSSLTRNDTDSVRTTSNTKKLILQWEKNNERIKNSSKEEPPDAARHNSATINKSRVRVISARDRDDIFMVNQFATIRRIVTREKAATLIQSHGRGFLARKEPLKTRDINATGGTSNHLNRKGSDLEAFKDASKCETLEHHRKQDKHEDSCDSSNPAFSHVEESDLNQHESESNSLKKNEKISMQVSTMSSMGTSCTTSSSNNQTTHSSDQSMKREELFNCKTPASEIVSNDQSPVCVRITVSKKIPSKCKDLNGQERKKEISNDNRTLARNEEVINREKTTRQSIPSKCKDLNGQERKKEISNDNRTLARNEEVINRENTTRQSDNRETVDEWTRLEQAFFTKTFSLLNHCSGMLTSGMLKCGGSLSYLAEDVKCIGPPHQGDSMSSDLEGLQSLLEEVKCGEGLHEKIASTEDLKRIGQQGEPKISEQQGRQEGLETSRKGERLENHTGENSMASENSSMGQKVILSQVVNSNEKDNGTEQKARTVLSKEELRLEETCSKKTSTTEKAFKPKKKTVIRRLFSKKRLSGDVQDSLGKQENKCNSKSTIYVDNEEEKTLAEIVEEREEPETSDECQTQREKPEDMHHSVMEYFSTDLSSSVHCGGLNCVQDHDMISDNYSDQGTPYEKSQTVALLDSNIDESGPTTENEVNESVEVDLYQKCDGATDDTRGIKTKKNGIRKFFSRRSRDSAAKFNSVKQS